LSTPENDIEHVAQRILEVIRRSDLSRNGFATKIGHRNLTKQLKAGKAPGTKILLAIHNQCPEISMDWLLTGRGNMYLMPYSQEDSALSGQDPAVTYQHTSMNELITSLQDLTEVVKKKL